MPVAVVGDALARPIELRASSGAVDAEMLREHCRAAVTGYKVPARRERLSLPVCTRAVG